jgi:predicted cupin superfamily sugar epimerase
VTADELISKLDLERHPEGGWYRETYRSKETVSVRGGRSLATAIYFLLRTGEVSHWHKVESDELWLFQGGDPLTLRLVPAGVWQSAIAPSDGPHGWTLVACVVAPGFDFADFTVADEGCAFPL